MSRQATTFAIEGGLDELSQPLAIPPGRAIAALNWEVLDTGYGRVEGFERYDGRIGPTSYPFTLLRFTGALVAVEAGQTVTGATSGASGVALADGELAGGAYDGSGLGTLGLRDVSGEFEQGEDLQVSGGTVALVASWEPGIADSGDETEEMLARAARDHARALIAEVPGSGPVRGVVEFGGTVYAFRDNADATSGMCYRATASGWQEIIFGKTLDFTGGSNEILIGDTITGATSGATATVERVIERGGTWSGGDAEGYLVLSGVTGTFQAENINRGGDTNVATVASDAEALNVPPGGRYRFITHNFYGASGQRRVYGVSGVGRAFEFSGTVISPIVTGMPFDAPTHVAEYRNHLFLAFPNGSVQHSSPANPVSFEAILGASEIAIGSDVTNFMVAPSSLIIMGKEGIFNLVGNDVTDFVLSPVTTEAGAIENTAQRAGMMIYLDNRGLRSIETTQAFGNFSMGTFTQTVRRTLASKRQLGVSPSASGVFRTKNQYRLFYTDGTGLSFYLGRKTPEAMPFDMGVQVTCLARSEGEDGTEQHYVGAANGFVYELDKGSSFDGEPIPAFCQLAYSHQGSPNQYKRYHKVTAEILAERNAEIGVAMEYDYSDDSQPGSDAQTVTARGSGGLWDVATWDTIYWSSPVENRLEAFVDGAGRNASTIFFSNTDVGGAPIIRGETIHFGLRGAIR